MDETDRLVTRLRQGDEAAFAALYGAHNDALVRLAHAITGSRATAEEVVQDSWLAIIRGIDGFEGRASLRNWIFRIVSNKARSRARRDGRIQPLHAASDKTGSLDDRFAADGSWIEPPALWDEITPERILAGRQAWQQVLTIIDNLPPIQQAILSLLEGGKLPAADIAALLDISPGNVRVQLHRARETIRDRIDRDLSPAKRMKKDP